MASKEFVVLLNNRVRFTTTEPVAIEDVISSLRGMERLVVHQLPRAIKHLTGARVEKSELLVNAIEDGSLIEDTVVRLVFDSKDEYDKFISGIRSKFVSKNAEGETVVKGWVAGALLAGIVIVAIAYWQKSPQGQGNGLVTVNGDNNVIVTIGAESYNKSPQEFQRALEKSLARQKPDNAARAAVQYLAPARSENGAGVELSSGNRTVQIVSPATIQKTPKAIENKDTSEDSVFKNVTINLRASDGDSEKRGWAGTIALYAETRTRIVFANPADIGKVMYRPTIKADVTINYSDKLHTKAKLIIVERVH